MKIVTEQKMANEEAEAAMSPRWITPLCTGLASPQSAGVTGRVFEASGHMLAVAEGWHPGPSTQAVDEPQAVDEVMRDLLSRTRAPAGMDGKDLAGREGR
jgi:hypothetical protein